MSDFDWNSFLRQWNDDVLASATADKVPADARDWKWLGFPPATEEQLATAEQRLGIPLPPSYRSFLAVSNGWKYVCRAVPRLWGVDHLDWFRKNEPDSVELWGQPMAMEPLPDDVYFSYDGGEQDYRTEHLRETLQIGPMGDVAFLLLNPQVISKEGEWECWMLASWIPGVHRYRSFREMMEMEHAALIGADHKQKTGLIGDLPDQFVGSPGSRQRQHTKPVLSSVGPPAEELLAALKDRELALRLFPKAAAMGKRPMPPGQNINMQARWRVAQALGYRRKAAAVPALIKLLSDDEHRLVRRAAIDALGEIGGAEAIDALFSKLDGGDSVAAMHALKKLAPDRLREPLLRELEKASLMTFPAAASVLAELKEKRALPILVGVMTNKDSPDHIRSLAGKCIAMFDLDGLATLKELLSSKDPNIRLLGVDAVGEIRRPQSREIMRGLLHDPDPAVREQADFWMALLPGPR
jgi:hypothetical protein